MIHIGDSIEWYFITGKITEMGIGMQKWWANTGGIEELWNFIGNILRSFMAAIYYLCSLEQAQNQIFWSAQFDICWIFYGWARAQESVAKCAQ